MCSCWHAFWATWIWFAKPVKTIFCGSLLQMCSLPYLLSVCLINLPVSFCSIISLSKWNLFIEPQQSAIKSFMESVWRYLFQGLLINYWNFLMQSSLWFYRSRHSSCNSKGMYRLYMEHCIAVASFIVIQSSDIF